MVGVEGSWDQKWVTWIRHTDAYKEHIYPDVQDGWYGLTSALIRTGIRLSIRVGKRGEATLRGGWEANKAPLVLALPAYLQLGGSYRW